MAVEGVNAEDLRVGDIVRYENQTWRTTDVSPYGREEVGIGFVRLDDDYQYNVNFRVGQLVELIEPTRPP